MPPCPARRRKAGERTVSAETLEQFDPRPSTAADCQPDPASAWVYFWANENDPLEPIHVHVSQGAPSSNATKIWITRAGKCYLCHNNSNIPPRVLRNIMAIIEARSDEVIAK